MAVIETFVGVSDDPAATKAIDNVELTTGAGQVLRQVTVIADAETPAARVRVTNVTPASNAFGSVVRPAPANFDSGILSVPAVDAAVVGGAINVGVLFLSNVTDQVQEFTLTDGAAVLYLDRLQLPPREVRILDFRGLTFQGVHWFAGAASAVQAQLKGDQ